MSCGKNGSSKKGTKKYVRKRNGMEKKEKNDDTQSDLQDLYINLSLPEQIAGRSYGKG